MKPRKRKFPTIIDRLRAQGKVTTLSCQQTDQFAEHIRTQMKPFRSELRRKQGQSWQDTHAIVLNA